MGMTPGINVEFLDNKRCVLIENLVHIGTNNSVWKMQELLEEARATKRKCLYDAVAVCLIYKLPESFDPYLRELPMNKYFWYGKHKITRVSANLYVVE